jgi:hypothetical protein
MKPSDVGKLSQKTEGMTSSVASHEMTNVDPSLVVVPNITGTLKWKWKRA